MKRKCLLQNNQVLGLILKATYFTKTTSKKKTINLLLFLFQPLLGCLFCIMTVTLKAAPIWTEM